MEAVVLMGIQASGKSTFYRARFFDTHVRISLDMLRTRRRERVLLEACIEAKQPFVVDNTCVTREERARYLGPARAAGFRVAGYFFEPDPRGAARRNAARPEAVRVPPAGLFGTLKRLQRPAPDEGFDELYRVLLAEGGGFTVEPWPGAAPAENG
ncbi:MAG TPA: AAA family ATPase [Longimicrobiaceae bacterium]|nr:AAA family ATPase [Longimicrobiaceae bacterium]